MILVEACDEINFDDSFVLYFFITNVELHSEHTE